MNVKLKGYVLGAVAAASYGLNPLFALPLYEAGMKPDSVLFFRYLFAIPLLALMLWTRRGCDFRLKRGQVLPLVVLGLLVALSSWTLFESYNYMAVGIASTLLFIYPILVSLIMVVGFREKLTLQTVLCLGLALVGIGLLYRNSGGETLSLVGSLFVFGSALSYALYIVGVNLPRLKDVATLKVTFYVLLFGISLFVVRLLLAGECQVPGKWYLWGNLLGLAVFPTAISFLCTTSAIQYIGSTPTAILGALEPLTAVLVGVLMFDESMTMREGVGLSLIIVAVTLVIAGGRITLHMTRFRRLFPRLRWPGHRKA